MFRLSDLYADIIKKPLPSDCGITCERLDPYTATLNRQLTESVSCYSYTLVTSGSQLVCYNGKKAFLKKNDIFIYTPGMMLQTLEVSEDYSSLCLMGDETHTYEIPYARNVISASYFPAAVYTDNKISLSEKDSERLKRRMNEIIEYLRGEHLYKNECLNSLYSVFILDLLDIENKIKKNTDISGHTADLFFRFMKLVTENFVNHHDIGFYADSLAVSTIYLSRIVKQFSGQTVKNHVDRLILMEASYMLATTSHPIASIAWKLNFATPASFCKFFTRHKGISPREYRTSVLSGG